MRLVLAALVVLPIVVSAAGDPEATPPGGGVAARTEAPSHFENARVDSTLLLIFGDKCDSHPVFDYPSEGVLHVCFAYTLDFIFNPRCG